jgi:iron complex transport system ATP-binding protein
VNLLEIKNLCFSYPGYADYKRVLNAISFSVKKGEFLSILGPNGSGKTTLLKTLAKLLVPTKGSIVLSGIDYSRFKSKDFFKIVGYVPQKFYSIFPYTVFEIILMGRTPYLSSFGFENDQDIDKVKNVLNILEIEELTHKSVNEISGGELQKVILARALAQDTDVLLLDEPSTHLDLKHQVSIFNHLKKINSAGKTIISVSHDINLSAIYSDRIIFLKEGSILEDGAISEVFTEEIIQKTFEVPSKIFLGDDRSLPQIFLYPLRTSE